MNAVNLYKIGNWFYKKRINILSKLCEILIYLIHNSYVPVNCTIGSGTIFAYKGIGVVIHARSVIGRNCLIGQGVTIGGKSGSEGVPMIGDNVYISPGARILGDINIGSNSIVGANAVVVKSVPPFSVVAGVPASVIDTITQSSWEQKYSYYGIDDYLR